MKKKILNLKPKYNNYDGLREVIKKTLHSFNNKKKFKYYNFNKFIF